MHCVFAYIAVGVCSTILQDLYLTGASRRAKASIGVLVASGDGGGDSRVHQVVDGSVESGRDAPTEGHGSHRRSVSVSLNVLDSYAVQLIFIHTFNSSIDVY